MTKLLNHLPDYVFSSSREEMQLLRYLLNDQVATSIASVVTDKMSPVQYADALMKTHHAQLYKFLCTLYPRGKKITNVLFQQSWTYDYLVTAAVLLRIIMIDSSKDLEESILLSVDASAFYLFYLEDENSQNANHAGLTFAGLIADRCMAAKPGMAERLYTVMLKRFGQALGNAGEKDWFLNDERWYKAVIHNEERLVAFRSFINIAIASYYLPDDAVEHNFKIKRKELIQDIDLFVELIEADDTDQEEITDFVRSVEHYYHGTSENPYLKTMYKTPWDTFIKTYRRVTGEDCVIEASPDRFQMAERKEWKMLESIDPLFKLETLMESDLTPFGAATNLIATDLEKAYTDITTYLASERDEMLLPFDQVDPAWAANIVMDTVYTFFVAARLQYKGALAADLIDPFMDERGFILLCVDDPEQERMGLAIAPYFLKSQLKLVTRLLTETEHEAINLLLSITKRLSDFRIDAPEEGLYNNVYFRSLFRPFLFFVMEVLCTLGKVALGEVTAASREEILEYIENLNGLLCNPNLDADEIIAFLTKQPKLEKSLAAGEMETSLWTKPFSTKIVRYQEPEETDEDDDVFATA